MNRNKAIKRQIRTLNISDTAKRELYNYLKYVDLTVEKDFSTKNYHIVINDYTQINLEKVVSLIKYILKSKLGNICIEIREDGRFSTTFGEDIYIVKTAKENFLPIDKRFSDFYWVIDLNNGSLEDMNKSILSNMICENGFTLEKNSNTLEILSKQNMQEAKKAVLLACSEANKMKSNIVKGSYFKDLLKENKSQNTIEELQNLVGLQKVKTTLNEIINYLRLQKSKNKIPMLHMFFLGNPGTGKTTVARLLGEILSGMRILSNGKIFVETTRADLIGRHIGETEEKTMKIIEQATGGILFIDEAYSLFSDKGSRDYGHNIIDILIREMENRKDNLCVIFAGYTNEMKDFIEMNSGLKSRVNFVIDFVDYSNEELLEIFERYLKEDNLFINGECKKFLIEYFAKIRQIKNFGNGREIRNIAEQLKIIQANRVIRNDDLKNANEITSDDIEILKKRNLSKYVTEDKRKIGF